MRALETQEIVEKRRKRRQIMLSIAMIVLLLGSTAGYAISLIADSDTGVDPTTNGPYFNGNAWIVPAGGLQFALQSSPDEVKNVSVEGSFSLANYQGQAVYIAADSSAIEQELSGVLGAFVQRLQQACYGPCNSTTLPEKDCSSNLIVWHASENRRVYTNASCVFIEGDYVAVDAFLYKLLGYA